MNKLLIPLTITALLSVVGCSSGEETIIPIDPVEKNNRPIPSREPVEVEAQEFDSNFLDEQLISVFPEYAYEEAATNAILTPYSAGSLTLSAPAELSPAFTVETSGDALLALGSEDTDTFIIISEASIQEEFNGDNWLTEYQAQLQAEVDIIFPVSLALAETQAIFIQDGEDNTLILQDDEGAFYDINFGGDLTKIFPTLNTLNIL